LTSSSSSLPGSAARCPLAAPPPLGVPVVPHPLYSTDHSSFVFRRASVPFSLAASRLRASVSPCFHASLASPRCLCPSLTAPPLRPSRLVSLPRAYSCGFHFRQSPGLGLNSVANDKIVQPFSQRILHPFELQLTTLKSYGNTWVLVLLQLIMRMEVGIVT
ncbi:hypothetical protein S83_028882, partial [Arachis hypogaea]